MHPGLERSLTLRLVEGEKFHIAVLNHDKKKFALAPCAPQKKRGQKTVGETGVIEAPFFSILAISFLCKAVETWMPVS